MIFNMITKGSGGGGEAFDELVMRTISVASGSANAIGSYAFMNCESLTTASFPAATYIGNSAFTYCGNLNTASFPAATYIGSSAFAYCTFLTTANFPVATYIGSSAFAYCSGLTTASFPAATSIGGNAFQNCKSLTTASFPAATSIGGNAFQKCYNLLSLYLLGSSVPNLANANAFSSTPISNYTTSTGGVHGSIFVPVSLYDSYISAANWSKYSSRFVSV